MDIAKNSVTPHNINPYLTLFRLAQLSQNVFYNWFIVITIQKSPRIHRFCLLQIFHSSPLLPFG